MTPTTGSPKINLYNLGSLGVNRVLSPVHKTDGEYLQAQNAQSDKHNQGRDAIKKRWGMTLYNALGFGSSVLAIHNLPYGGFADSTGSTGSTGSTASWPGWVEPFALWSKNGPIYWDGAAFQSYGTWTEGPWQTGYSANRVNANATTTGKYYSPMTGYDDPAFTQGDIAEFDVMTPSYAKVASPPAAPGANPDSGNGWRVCDQQGDPDFVALSFLDYALATGYRQWLYLYQVSANAWVQVGDMAQYGTGSTYPMMYGPQDATVVFGGRVYIIRAQTKQANQTQKYIYTIESASATSPGSWTVEYTWDGGTTYQSTLQLFSDGYAMFVFGRLGGSAGGGAPYTYVNKRSYNGSTWTDSPSSPSSIYTTVINIDKERTTGGAIFAYGDAFNPGGGTVYPVMVSVDQSSTWTTVSLTDAGWPVGLASPYYAIWRAGDQYFLNSSPDGMSYIVVKSSASTLPTLNWTTISGMAPSPYGGSVMSLTPRTRF